MNENFEISNYTFGRETKLPGSEASLQNACAKYLDLLRVLYFHPPNGGSRRHVEAAIFKGHGVKAGVSDLVILEPRSQYHGLMVELKAGRNTLSIAQVEFLKNSWLRGYKVAVCYTFDSFRQVVDDYLKK